MKIANLERLFIIGASLVLNKLFLFWLTGASNMFVMIVTFVALILNFMILAKSVDKFIDIYEKAKRSKQDLIVEEYR